MKLYVGNLGEEGDVKSSDLRPLFERFGPVSECECIKNYAYVYYDRIPSYRLAAVLSYSCLTFILIKLHTLIRQA